jgi:hypothetical protein
MIYERTEIEVAYRKYFNDIRGFRPFPMEITLENLVDFVLWLRAQPLTAPANLPTPEQLWPQFKNQFPCNYSPGQFRDIMNFARCFGGFIWDQLAAEIHMNERQIEQPEARLAESLPAVSLTPNPPLNFVDMSQLLSDEARSYITRDGEEDPPGAVARVIERGLRFAHATGRGVGGAVSPASRPYEVGEVERMKDPRHAELVKAMTEAQEDGIADGFPEPSKNTDWISELERAASVGDPRTAIAEVLVKMYRPVSPEPSKEKT